MFMKMKMKTSKSKELKSYQTKEWKLMVALTCAVAVPLLWKYPLILACIVGMEMSIATIVVKGVRLLTQHRGLK